MQAAHGNNGARMSASMPSIRVANSRFTLFLRVHSAEKLQLATSTASYCKLYLGETPVVNATHATMSNLFVKDNGTQPEHRTYHTKVYQSQHKSMAVWNEKFELPLGNPKKEVLSIRVKSQHPLYCPSIGACAIHLKQMKAEKTIDQSFPLFKGNREVGSIRLQMMIKDAESPGEYDKEKEKKKHKQRDQELADEEAERDRKRRERQKEKEREAAEEEKRRRRREEEAAEREKERLRRKKLEEEEQEREREREERLRRKRLEEEEALARRRREEEEIAMQRKMSNGSRSSSRHSNRGDNQESDVFYGSEQVDKKIRPSSHRRRSTQEVSIEHAIGMVVQNALPSDSEEGSSDAIDSDDEQELLRQMAMLKLKMKKKREKARTRGSSETRLAEEPTKKSRCSSSRQAHSSDSELDDYKERRRSAARSPPRSSKYKKRSTKRINSSDSELDYVQQVSDSYSSSSASSSSSRRRRKSKPSKTGRRASKAKSQDVDRKSSKVSRKSTRSTARSSSSSSSSSDSDNQGIKALSPGDIAKQTGRAPVSAPTFGQVWEATSSLANLTSNDDDNIVELIPNTIEAINHLAPIGKFLGQKLQEASAKVVQGNEPNKNATYYF